VIILTETARDIIIERLHKDLIGPHEEDENLDSKPSDVYLTGMLWPCRTRINPEENERLENSGSETGDNEDPNEAGEEEAVPLSSVFKPSSIGISFAVEYELNFPMLNFNINFAKYNHKINIPDDFIDNLPDDVFENSKYARKRIPKTWQREPYSIYLNNIEIKDKPSFSINLEKYGAPPDVKLYIRVVQWEDKKLITATLVNELIIDQWDDYEKFEAGTLFQVKLEIIPGNKTRFVSRPCDNSRIKKDNQSDQAFNLLYRNVKEYATGHTCSADWIQDEKTEKIIKIVTSWIPQTTVHSVDPNGCDFFKEIPDNLEISPFTTSWIVNTPNEKLFKGLYKIPEAYDKWIKKQTSDLEVLSQEHKVQGKLNLENCNHINRRIIEGIEFLQNNSIAAEAFRLANAAMALQNSWIPERKASDLKWRPFQLGFILLTIASLSDETNRYRNTMDLLWFPTGGGKTEAYLALIAYISFYRRLKEPDNPDNGAGVVSIMRYTLRLLTTQQFSRASAMILACEAIRLGKAEIKPSKSLGQIPFSIGLWVGGSATPNNFQDFIKKKIPPSSTPDQLQFCPACKTRLKWWNDKHAQNRQVTCPNTKCILYAGPKAPLPIYTIDTTLYQKRPTLVISTVDKFATITRRAEIDHFFSISENNPPVFIIQDELHLISGPLGTIFGLYESAIDFLLTKDGRKPKVIGSTATIKRADEQIKGLFDRESCLFPPSGINWDDSGFAVTDFSKPGRKYLAITTAGRSAKFTLRGVSSSLLQSVYACYDDLEKWDPYSTLLVYFNSLRELGGAVVLMQDDVHDAIDDICRYRKENKRKIENVEELTSRLSQEEVLELLHKFEIKANQDECLDVVLATNMVSVGVDISRLGLMVVLGQPKGRSEYIQATSRVGRQSPGLIVSILNSAKARDRSHYETFRNWHQALYRDVEATSVTPYASRARERALHAALVAIIRFKIDGMREHSDIKHVERKKLNEIITYLVSRAYSIDPDETGVEKYLEKKLESWIRRNPPEYWGGDKIRTLLIDAEKVASLNSLGGYSSSAWPTMNNMRSVEPSCAFKLKIDHQDGG
jgi:hypothetical protein